MTDFPLVRGVRHWSRTVLIGFALLGSAQAFADTAPVKSIAILDFELLDDQIATVPDNTLGPRLAAITAQMREEFAREDLYRVVDNAPAAALIEKSTAMQNFRNCNGCETDVARLLGADRVLVGWVQKVSNLILNLNIQIEDAATGQVLLNKSVDLRGNTDLSWSRGVSYMVKSMVEKHQGDR